MNRALLLTFLLLVSSLAIAQDYRPLLDDYNEWKLTTCYFGCISDPYWTDGDTLVDGQVHKILDGYHYIERKYLLREEGQKVYFTRVIDEVTTEQFLLYDFGLQVGDVFEMKNPLSPFPTNGGPFVLDSIVERTLVDGQGYDHYYFTPHPSNIFSNNPAVWVEGVGSLSMVNAPGGDPDINGVGALSCFFKEGQLFYQNLDSIQACEPVLGLADRIRTQSIDWKLSQGSLSFMRLTKDSQVAIYTLNGQAIASDLVLQDGQLYFNTTSWADGVYLVLLTDPAGQTSSLKILIRAH